MTTTDRTLPGKLARARSALGFTQDEVALAAGWSRQHQRQLEREDDPTDVEADRLEAILGVDIVAVLEGAAAPAAGQPLGHLLKGQATALDAGSRLALGESVQVARALQGLQARLGGPTGLGRLLEFPDNNDHRHPSSGNAEALALQVREVLGLGDGPISSVTRQLLEPLGVTVLWTRIRDDIDAVGMADEATGGVIVANLSGPHANSAYGRRVVWAHELCHLMFDRAEMPRFARFCQLERPEGRPGMSRFERIERRARAFAVWLLVPRQALLVHWRGTRGAATETRVRAIMEHFGLGYEAVRGHLANCALLPMEKRLRAVPTGATRTWEEADPYPELVPDVPPLRGELVKLAERAHMEGLVSARWVEEQRFGPLAGVRALHSFSPIGVQTSSMLGLASAR